MMEVDEMLEYEHNTCHGRSLLEGGTLTLPKPTWHMSIGSLNITHTEPLSLWQRMGLRFLGWKVCRAKDDR